MGTTVFRSILIGLVSTGLVFLTVSCGVTREDVIRNGIVRLLEKNAPRPYTPDALEIIVTGSGGPMPADTNFRRAE